MIHAIIHYRSTFTGATDHGTMPLQFFDAADADEFMRKLDRSFPGIIHTWKPTAATIHEHNSPHARALGD